MKGNETFKIAVKSMEEAAQEAAKANGVALGDIDVFIPHQANMRILKAVSQRSWGERPSGGAVVRNRAKPSRLRMTRKWTSAHASAYAVEMSWAPSIASPFETRSPAQVVDGLEAPSGNQPGARVARDTVARPLLDGGDEGVVQGLLGQLEIAEQADKGRQHAPRLLAVQRLDAAAQRLAVLPQWLACAWQQALFGASS